MSSPNVSLTDMRRNVEQLKLQASVERIKVRMKKLIMLTEEINCIENADQCFINVLQSVYYHSVQYRRESLLII